MICAQIFRKFFIPHEIQCFRLQVVFFSLSHFVCILSPTQFAIMGMLNMVTMEHTDGAALPRYAMAQCTYDLH